MRIIVISISFILFVSSVHLSLLDKTDGIKEVQTTNDADTGDNPIKFTLLSDEKDGPNRFTISYEVNYGEFVFKRSEKCHITELNNGKESENEMVCSGKTKFSRTGDIKNITNFDDYTYSTNGFNHSGQTFKMSGNFYHLNEIDLSYFLDPEPITLKLDLTTPVKKLQFEHIGKNKLIVNLTIDSAYFSMNRTENFSVILDEDNDTNDLTCSGQINLMERNSEKNKTIQNEYFELDEQYSFIYESEIQLNNNVTYIDSLIGV